MAISRVSRPNSTPKTNCVYVLSCGGLSSEAPGASSASSPHLIEALCALLASWMQKQGPQTSLWPLVYFGMNSISHESSAVLALDSPGSLFLFYYQCLFFLTDRFSCNLKFFRCYLCVFCDVAFIVVVCCSFWLSC